VPSKTTSKTSMKTTSEVAPVEVANALTTARSDPAHNAVAVYLRSLSTGSRATMTSALRACVAVFGADTDIFAFPWHELRYSHTSAVRSALAERYAPAQANKVLSALKGVLKAAWRLEQISDADYLRAIDVANVKGSSAPVGRAVETDEIGALLQVCAADPSPAGLRDAAILAVGFGCGLRRGEIAGLDRSDWKAKDRELVVRKAKGNKARVVHLNLDVAGTLKAWLRVRGAGDGALFQPVTRGGRIQRDKRMSAAAVGEAVGRRAVEAGLEPVRAHDLRRSHISSLLDAGVDLATVQAMAGHASPTTTSRYDRRPVRAQKQAAERLVWPAVSRHGVA
jgi:integrase